ncbi:MAG TPA: lysophospholipid acyltransferase family protein [Elusimicrobiota bacterium]|jgi:1-acyl-sn-glycerol-3-phosphate acyltransferase|nr:lysophospholipid acyltransferase family protein [Elusimicrobiota bacterium]
MRVEGTEHIPARGPLLVAANHVSWIDPPLVSMAVYSVRFPQFMAKEELFRVPLLGFFLDGIACIPLDRSKGDVGAIRRALEVLASGGCVGVFPEGTRSRDGKPRRPKAGVGLLARTSGAPVVPARVWNTDKFLARPLRVRFGPPLRFDGGEDRSACQAFAERVMESIFALQ